MSKPDPSNDTARKPSRWQRVPRWLRWTLEIAVFIGVLLGVRAYMAPELPSGPIPTITAHSLDGRAVTLGAKSAQPSVVVFWATWCGICHVEMPWLNQLAKDHPDERIIAIAMQSGQRDAVEKYLKQNDLTDLTVVNDPQGRIARQFGVTVTPTLLFFDRQGRIGMAETGITSPWGIRLRLWWLGLHD